jgi:AcrR family transcriptional regulator
VAAEERRTPGRPRSARLDEAILAAAREQLATLGYARMSLASIAAAAGTTVPAVRRRYASKAELAAAVIGGLRSSPLPEPSGSPRDDALRVLADFGRQVRRPDTMAVVGTLLVEERRHPEMIGLFKSELVDSRRKLLRRALEAGVAAGELPPDSDLDAMTSMLVGAFYARYLTLAGIPSTWAERVLSVVWPPPARDARPRRRRSR